jgi:hypothetical protein
MKPEFFDLFPITLISNSMKIPVGAGLFHPDGHTDGRTDRPTDMAKLIVAFHRFANAPKNEDYLIKSSALSQCHLIFEPLTK